MANLTVGPFRVDEDNSDDDHLYVDIRGLGTVVLIRTDEGVIIDVYPLFVIDKPIATMAIFESEFNPE